MLQEPCDTKQDLPFVITVEPTSEQAVRDAVDGNEPLRLPARAAAGAADGTAAVTRLAALFLLPVAALPAQVAGHANEHYQTPEQRQDLVRGLGRPGRDATQKPAELVDAMALKPGMVVADVGTGVGYMLPYLSRAVGPTGRVLAEDIFDDFLKEAARTAETANSATSPS